MPALNTQISSITVYPDRARVTRTGRLSLERGAQSVTIASLPVNLDESSVRAAGKGNARITGVQMNLRYSAEAAPGAARDAQLQVQALQDQDRILADEEDAWKQRLAVVKGIGEHGGEDMARNLARGKLALDTLTGVLDYLSQSQEAAATILRDLAIRRRDLAKQIEAAQQEADKLANAAQRAAYEAQVNLKVAEASELEIELTYTVPNASWEAHYDARLEGETLEWTYLAQVQQQTGEDWMLPFDLTLSTATLATGLDKPELPPWRVDVYRPPEPYPRMTRAMGPMVAAAPEAMMVAQPPASMPKLLYDSAQVDSSGPSVTYKISAPRAIPSDGEPHQVAVATLSFPVALDYFSAPKIDEHAFVRAKFNNTSEYVMLAGDVALYHGADFVGTRAQETIVPHQEVELFLGAEERIQVERQEIERTVDKNLLGNTAR